ncbi:hypothetical protein N9B94_04670, partial [Verrucomicrobia bacterium]|nr:hypothetical protein [Verrucomicrobiota bacterium]
MAGIFLVLLTSISIFAQAPINCHTCDKPIGEKYWNHPKGKVCGTCIKSKRICWTCSLPAIKGYVQTKDGRVICRDEAKDAVLNEAKATKIFQQTSIATARMTRGKLSLKSKKVSIKLFDFDYWNSKGGGKNPQSDGMHRAGIAFSRNIGGRVAHNVLLISGYQSKFVRATSAHEFTHLWINENLAPDRKIEKHTAEAICELVALKLARSDKEPDVIKHIVENPYTAGRIKTAMQMEEKFGINAVLEWVRKGTSPTLTEKAVKPFAKGRTVKKALPRSPLYSTTRKKTPPPSNELQLKGILGSTALIGRNSFKIGEAHKMLVNGKEESVKCIEVTPTSVT